MQPLPGGKLPADQTLEGGAQIRVTKQGVEKLTAIVPGFVNEQVGSGICVPEGTQYSVDYCYETQNHCTKACDVDVALNGTRLLAKNSATLTVRLDVAVYATVPTDAPFFDPCYIYVNGEHVYGDANIELKPDATTGQLSVQLVSIDNFNLSQLILTGSGGFCSGASSFGSFLKNYFAEQIGDYLAPRLNQFIQDQLPDPLGVAGVADLGPLLAGISPGSDGALEARIVPGGFATVSGPAGTAAQGVTLGVVTGFNADENPGTRGADVDSEPALCVPPLLPPAFGAAPHNLTTTARQTFAVPEAAGLPGWADPIGRDLSVGLSETSLDLIGHHAVTSGALCLGIGTALVPQLNVGTFGILVPSVAELGSDEGNDPMLLVTRPQRAIDFSIGDNTDTSAAVTIHLRDFEIDVYPFLFERYTRAFTMSATLDIGVNVDFDKPALGPWRVIPTLVGLEASDVTIKVLNSQFVAESAAQLEGALPSVFNLLTSQLSIPPVDLPTFAGFEITNPSVGKATGPSGAFLTINADLDVSTMMRQLALTDRFMAEAVAHITRDNHAPGPRAAGRARLATIDAPPVEDIRLALGKQGGRLPAITLDVDRLDARGRELEWSWRLGDGMWRPYASVGDQLVITDRALAWQGVHTIGVRSRAKGEPATASEETRVPVVIDSVGPHVVSAKTGWEGDWFVVRGFDVVGAEAIRIAFGTPGDHEPQTEWQTGARATLSRAELTALGDGGDLAVFLEDERGNRTIATVAPFHGQAGASGCSCDAGASTPGAGFLLVLLTVVGLRRGRRR